MPEQDEREWATIGTIVALFGIHGEVKVRPSTDIPNRFEQLASIYVGPEKKLYTLEHVRPYKGEMLLLKFKGIDDANTAELLRGSHLLIPVAQLAALPPDSYYQHDILGLRVKTLDERDLGPIIDIIETGSNDVYVIKASDGKQILIPAIKAVVKSIDITRHLMYIEAIPGLLDDEEVPPAYNEENEYPEGEA